MAGAGYKLFNTGDVLTAAQVNTYLQEQVVMVFNDATARTTALSGVLAEGMVSYLKSTKVVEIYNGTAWASLDDPNAIQNTIVDAKGDLISASGNDVPARLAVGNNGETLVADSSTSTGLRWQEPKASNPIINSSFQVWQRGTSLGGNANYTADRWYAGTSAAGRTISRQTTNDTTNLPNIQYCARVQRDSGNTATNSIKLIYNFESVDSIPFVGKTVTLSFYARAGANFSGANSRINTFLVSGTGTDQNQDSGFTGQATPINQTPTLTTTWQRFSYSAIVATTVTQLAVRFDYTPVGTAGAADYFEVTGVQVEAGSVATPYRSYSATLAGELAACQRYYYRQTATGDVYQNMGFGMVTLTTTASRIQISNPVTMRVKPTAVDYANVEITDFGAGYAISALTVAESANFSTWLTATQAAGTAYRPVALRAANNNAGYVGLSAEL